MQWICRCCLGLLPLVGYSREIPEPVLPAGVGVNIHFVRGHEQDLDMIQAAGFRFIRMDFGWGATERVKGEYHWSDYEELMGNLDRRGLGAVFILDYSNPHYEEEIDSTNPLTHKSHRTVSSPQHPESVAAYAAWAAAAARHFGGRHVIWEIWNEPNIDFWSPKPDVNQYITLALAAAKAIRETDPEATIVGPASSGFPWEFLETFLKSGVLEWIDAVSVHPYRSPQKPPETAVAEYGRLKELIQKYAPAYKKDRIPILSGEWGYSSWQRGVSLETQAAFAVRQQLLNLFSGVPLSIWYDWKNDGADPNENEHNFGTVAPDLSPKPAYHALQILTRELTGYRCSRRLPVESSDDFVLIFSDPAGSQKLAAWTLAEPHPVRLGLTGDSRAVTVVLGNGDRPQPGLDAGVCVLNLTRSPSFVTLGKASVK